jgi:hypothetical protein
VPAAAPKAVFTFPGEPCSACLRVVSISVVIADLL